MSNVNCVRYKIECNEQNTQKSRFTNVKQTFFAPHIQNEVNDRLFFDRRREQLLVASLFYSLQKQKMFHHKWTRSRTGDTSLRQCRSSENNWRSSQTRATIYRTADRKWTQTITIKARANLADEQHFECNTNYVLRVFHQFHWFICVFFILSNRDRWCAGVRP